MTKNILYVLTLSLLLSCGQNSRQAQPQAQENQTSDSLAVTNDPKDNLNIQVSTFSEIDSSGVLMFPLSVGETERARGSLSYKEAPNNAYWNIIFYNSKTKVSHLLSERKMLIGRYDYKYESEVLVNTSLTSNYIFYTVRTDDFNKDQQLTDQDPEYLFVSDRFGNQFKQISPANCDLKNWKFIKSSNKVILTIGRDSDKNSKFDDHDETATFEIELGKDTEAREIFDNDFKNKLKMLFNRDWKRPQK